LPQEIKMRFPPVMVLAALGAIGAIVLSAIFAYLIFRIRRGRKASASDVPTDSLTPQKPWRSRFLEWADI
jgi:hypothetical protein